MTHRSSPSTSRPPASSDANWEHAAITGEAPVLTITGLSQHFGGLQALTDVSFTVPRGEVTALIGPNGAGKTTLFSVVAGDMRPSRGAVALNGADITGWEPHRVCRLGIVRTFQNPRLFANLSCLENVITARFGRTSATLVESVLALPRARKESTEGREIAEELLRRVGISDARTRMPHELSYGNRRRLEIARALATEPTLLLMDEPSAGMASHVIDELMVLIQSLTVDGRTVVLVEHNMSVVKAVARKVVVLDHGRKISEGRPNEVLADPVVIEAYLGVLE